MDRALIGFRSCYHFEHIDIAGYPCKTNMPSNTAFRGFGSPQVSLVRVCRILLVSTILCVYYISEIDSSQRDILNKSYFITLC